MYIKFQKKLLVSLFGDHELIKWIMIFGAVQTIAISLGGMHDSSGWSSNMMMLP